MKKKKTIIFTLLFFLVGVVIGVILVQTDDNSEENPEKEAGVLDSVDFEAMADQFEPSLERANALYNGQEVPTYSLFTSEEDLEK